MPRDHKWRTTSFQLEVGAWLLVIRGPFGVDSPNSHDFGIRSIRQVLGRTFDSREGALYTLPMPIPTEPIGSIPRPPELIEAVREFEQGRLVQEELDALYADALRDTIQRFEATGSPVITDGE